MKSVEIKRLLGTFKLHRKLTRDLLVSLNPELLSLKPFSISGSFGKQFRHILDIEMCYVESITKGSLDFRRPHIDHTMEGDKDRLIRTMDAVDTELENSLEKMDDSKANEKYIDCRKAVKYLGDAYRQASPVQILSLLTEHEIFHDGEMALYVRTVNIRFPDSWMMWGLR
jgi:uncharacterized damage-inducible protein DinB